MKNSKWDAKGKTISCLISELLTFEDQEMEVRISVDKGYTSLPISLVGKMDGEYAVLFNFEDVPTPIRHRDKA